MQALIKGMGLTTLLLTAALTGPGAHADKRESVNETREVTPGGFVRITVVRGDLKVESWDRSHVRVTGELDEQKSEFIFEVTGDNTHIEVKLPRSLNSWCCEEGSSLVVTVPRNSRVDISAVSTDIVANDLMGGLDVGGVSGNVRLGNLKERANIRTVSGDIELRKASGRIELKSVSGDIDAIDVTGDVRLHSVSGNLLARNAEEELEVETVSGDIEVINAVYSSLTGHTVSGDVDLSGTFSPGARLEFDSVSGTIRVQFKGDVDARFDVQTGSGSIRNRLTPDRPVKSKYVRDEVLRFVKAEGKGEARISTRSGDVVLGN